MIKSQLIFGFYGEPNIKDKFKTGTLIFTTEIGNLKFMATSGLKHHQGIGDCSKRGKGGIPPCKFVGLQKYTVSTTPISMPQVKGVEGNFYQIFPFEVTVDQYGRKSRRGDFGIHADMNIQGTAGCIGIPRGTHWNEFERVMAVVKSTGEKTVDLFVPEAR